MKDETKERVREIEDAVSGDCNWMMPIPQPAAPGGGSETGAWYECRPASIASSVGNALAGTPTRWLETMPDGSSSEAALAARQAIVDMQLEPADIGTVPKVKEKAPGSMAIVGMPMWMWMENGADNRAWGPYTVTEEVDGLSVQATASARGVHWDMGDGKAVYCTTPGTPYQRSYKKQESPDCGYKYEETGAYTVTATTEWDVEWQAEGESGLIQTTTQSTGELDVGESHALNVKPRG